MPRPGLGLVLDGAARRPRELLQAAAGAGFRQIELPTVAGDLAPENLSRSGQRALSHFVAGLGLELSALGGDVGGRRFGDPGTADQLLDKTRRIMELAATLKVPVVTTHLGSANEHALRQGHLRQVMQELADLSDRTGTLLTVETGGADPQTLAGLFREIDCPTLGACYDPASLLIDGFDPLAGVDALAERIRLARVRDALAGAGDRPGRETAVGQGQIDLPAYLAALDQAGYRGTAFLRRSQADRPVEGWADARHKLESWLG